MLAKLVNTYTKSKRNEALSTDICNIDNSRLVTKFMGERSLYNLTIYIMAINDIKLRRIPLHADIVPEKFDVAYYELQYDETCEIFVKTDYIRNTYNVRYDYLHNCQDEIIRNQHFIDIKVILINAYHRINKVLDSYNIESRNIVLGWRKWISTTHDAFGRANSIIYTPLKDKEGVTRFFRVKYVDC